MWTSFHCEQAYFSLLVFVVAFVKRLSVHAEGIVASSTDHELKSGDAFVTTGVHQLEAGEQYTN